MIVQYENEMALFFMKIKESIRSFVKAIHYNVLSHIHYMKQELVLQPIGLINLSHPPINRFLTFFYPV
jgi:hypothetical protein